VGAAGCAPRKRRLPPTARRDPRCRTRRWGKRVPTTTEEVAGMPLWLLILIIVLVVLALGGFGYSRY
jgi:hypothetical protein